MANLKIHPFQSDDIVGISEVERRLTGHSKSSFLEKRFAAVAATPDTFITCTALRDGKVVGYACARIEEGEFGTRDSVAVLDILGIDRGSQGKGIGKELLAEVERKLKERKIGFLRTQVDWRNRDMIRFFSSAGALLTPIQIMERNTAHLGLERMTNDAAGIPSTKNRRGAGGKKNDILEWDRVLVRSLREEDLAALVRIDRKYVGHERPEHYAAKLREVLTETGIRVSFVAEQDGFVVGFIMAKVDLGEFGKVDKAAVLDAIGVHPAFAGSGIGRALLSQLIMNLASLHVENIFTQITLSQKYVDMMRFLYSSGFQPSQRLMLSKAI